MMAKKKVSLKGVKSEMEKRVGQLRKNYLNIQ